MAPDQEATDDNLRDSFRFSNTKKIDDAILMSTHNIQFYDEKNNYLNICFWGYRKNFVGIQNEFELATLNELQCLCFDVRLYNHREPTSCSLNSSSP